MGHNRTNSILAVIMMSAILVSCTAVREFRNRPSEKLGKLNESIPAGLENAESDYRIDDPANFKVILLESGQILLQDPESPPIDLATLGQNAKAFAATKSPDMKDVYLAASVDIPAAEISTILDELRKQDIDTAKLLTSSRNPAEDEDGGFSRETRGPDSVFEVKIHQEIVANDRPNPLTLLIAAGRDGNPVLNNEPQEDLAELTLRLSEIFKMRESTGVFRENTNEVEKTVLVRLAGGSDTAQKYGEIVKLVDAAKGGGASPIVLLDEATFSVVMGPQRPVSDPSIRLSPKAPPKIISGGVLNGKAISLPKPLYPPAARAVNATGSVSVQVTVDTDGKVIDATAVSGHPLLRPAAVAAARSAEFSPTLLSGQPVKVTGVITYNFVP